MNHIFTEACLIYVICLVFFTFPLGEVIEKQVLGTSREITGLGHQSLFNGVESIYEYKWFGTKEQTVNISIRLPQLRENKINCHCYQHLYNDIRDRIPYNHESVLIFSHRHLFKCLITMNANTLMVLLNVESVYVT